MDLRLLFWFPALVFLISACVSAPQKPSVGGNEAVRIVLFHELCFFQADNRNARIRVYQGHERGFNPLVDIRFDAMGRPVEVAQGFGLDTYTYHGRSVRREQMEKGNIFRVIVYTEGADDTVQFTTIEGAPQYQVSGSISRKTDGLRTTYRSTVLDGKSGTPGGTETIVASMDGRPLAVKVSGYGEPERDYEWIWQGNRLLRIVVTSDGKPSYTINYGHDLLGRINTVTYTDQQNEPPVVNEVGYD